MFGLLGHFIPATGFSSIVGVIIMMVATASASDKPSAADGPTLKTAEDFGLPRPGMVLNREKLAVVCTDPQVDFLGEKGAAWPVIKKSASTNNTIENIETVIPQKRQNAKTSKR